MSFFNATKASFLKGVCPEAGSILENENLPNLPGKAVDLFAVIFNAITCPVTILSNALVIVAVKTKPQLRNINSNITLACLATTDMLVGSVLQPFYITMAFLSKQGEIWPVICHLRKAFVALFAIICTSSLYHLVLVSGERYLAIKRSFSYQTTVTGSRIIAASFLAWTLAAIPTIVWSKKRTKVNLLGVLLGFTPRMLGIASIIYFHLVVYCNVRHHEKKIVQQQVSVEAKKKMLKEKKALKTTTYIIGALAACYAPSGFRHFSVSEDVEYVLLSLAMLSMVFNSFLNPLIYTVRNSQFRVAFIQLLTGINFQQAKSIERYHFRSRNVVVPLCAQGQVKEEEPERVFERHENGFDENASG